MNYMVTGGYGVIGSRLVELLQAKGHNVIVIDRRMDPLGQEMNVDITRFEELWSVFKDQDIDCVIHLAGEVGRMVGELRPNRMTYVNIIGTMNLIQMCLDKKAKLVLFSTSEIYGNLGDTVMSEELEQTIQFKPTNIYAMTKLFAEKFARHYNENYDLKSIAIRPFMVYGPGEQPGPYRSAISNFIYKALVGEKITVHEGTVRSWTFVDDFVEGVLSASEKGDFENSAAYNIGRDDPTSMEEVARVALKLAGREGEDLIELVPPPTKFLSPIKLGSFKKVETELGFVAQTTLEEGMRKTMEWQKQHVLGHSDS
jgi:dTDP-glucose 4,6-dehydratase